MREQLDAGSAAMARGEWSAARECFRSAWSGSESADALDGLARALWWLNHPGGALELRARAFALLRQPEARHLVQEGDMVSAWFSNTGTHESDFAGVPAGGRKVRFAAWDLLRMRDGKNFEITQHCDLFTITSRIGALPTATPV